MIRASSCGCHPQGVYNLRHAVCTEAIYISISSYSQKAEGSGLSHPFYLKTHTIMVSYKTMKFLGKISAYRPMQYKLSTDRTVFGLGGAPWHCFMIRANFTKLRKCSLYSSHQGMENSSSSRKSDVKLEFLHLLGRAYYALSCCRT